MVLEAGDWKRLCFTNNSVCDPVTTTVLKGLTCEVSVHRLEEGARPVIAKQ